MNMYDRRRRDDVGGEKLNGGGGGHDRWGACENTQGILSGIFDENKIEDRQEFESSRVLLEMTGLSKTTTKEKQLCDVL